jgi:serine/threonine protein kinase
VRVRVRALSMKISEMTLLKTLGTGSCGQVLLYSWKGTMVAVKRIFRTLLHGDEVKEFEAESGMLRKLRHPNIVLFMGTSIENNDMCMFTEYMSKGTFV